MPASLFGKTRGALAQRSWRVNWRSACFRTRVQATSPQGRGATEFRGRGCRINSARIVTSSGSTFFKGKVKTTLRKVATVFPAGLKHQWRRTGLTYVPAGHNARRGAVGKRMFNQAGSLTSGKDNNTKALRFVLQCLLLTR